MSENMSATEQTAYWIVVGSPGNFEKTRELGFSIQGLKSRHRKKAERMKPGDKIAYYIPGRKAFGLAQTPGGHVALEFAQLQPEVGSGCVIHSPATRVDRLSRSRIIERGAGDGRYSNGEQPEQDGPGTSIGKSSPPV